MTESMTTNILNLSTWSYKQGSIDAVNNLKDSFNIASTLTGKKQFSIEEITQIMDRTLIDLEKEHTEKPPIQ